MAEKEKSRRERREEAETENETEVVEAGDEEAEVEGTGESEGEVAEASLFDKIVAHSGVAMTEGEKLHAYKQRLVTHYNGLDDDAFEEIPTDIAEWVNEAIAEVKDAKKEKREPKFPVIDGEPKNKRRAKGDPKPQKERVGRNPEDNRYHRIADVLIQNPELCAAPVEQIVAAMKKSGHDYSDVTVNRGREAFNSVVGALRKHGKLPK